VGNRLTVLLLHLLKWQYQSALRGNIRFKSTPGKIIGKTR
jgi:hypothetical protein